MAEELGAWSQTAVATIRDLFTTRDSEAPARFLPRAVQQANTAVYAAARTDRQLFNMQTSLTALLLHPQELVVAHVGDCRLYQLRNGEVEVLTRDHTLAMDLLRLRVISPEEAAEHPGRYQLTRSLGTEPQVRVDLSRDIIVPGDAYLLCSHGLWGRVTVEEIGHALEGRGLPEVCRDLVDLALERDGGDNMTAILFRITGLPVIQSPVGKWQGLLPWRKSAR